MQTNKILLFDPLPYRMRERENKDINASEKRKHRVSIRKHHFSLPDGMKRHLLCHLHVSDCRALGKHTCLSSCLYALLRSKKTCFVKLWTFLLHLYTIYTLAVPSIFIVFAASFRVNKVIILVILLKKEVGIKAIRTCEINIGRLKKQALN